MPGPFLRPPNLKEKAPWGRGWEFTRMRKILMLMTSVRVKIQLNLYERCFTVFLNSCEFPSLFGFLFFINIDETNLAYKK